MAFNPKSLENLNKGTKPGSRKRLTRAYLTDLMDFMVNDLPNFLAEIEQLELKDRVAAKLKIIDMVKPKDINLNFEDEDGETVKPVWVLNFTPNPVKEITSFIPLEEQTDRIDSKEIEQNSKPFEDEIKIEFT